MGPESPSAAWPPPVPPGQTFQAFPRPPGGPVTTGLATASLVCGILGILCLTQVFGVILGIAALIRIFGAPHVHKGKGLALAGIALSLAWFVGMLGLALFSPQVRGAFEGGPIAIPVMPAPGPPTPPPLLPGTPAPGVAIALSPTAGPLDRQILAQVATAEATGRHAMVFFTAGWCAPCQAVKRTLSAPDLVVRLARLQMIEVDVDAFPAPELERVGLTMMGHRVDAIPLLCAVRSNLPPSCMAGDAWGDDTDVNIRTVLVPFLEAPPSGLGQDVPRVPVPI